MRTKQELEEKYGHLKDAFVGQYTGQSVANYGIESSTGKVNGYKWLIVKYLQLKPLSNISDEDLKELGFRNEDEFSQFLFYGNDPNNFRLLKLIDQLRSKGYALPYMGITVEEQIALGWVKLKE